MFRVDGRNWTVPKDNYWYTGVTFGALQRVLVCRPRFQL